MISEEAPRALTGVIFDCDGVMIDSEEGNRYMYNKTLGALGLPPMTKEQEEYAFMATAIDAFRHMTPPEIHDRLEQIIRENIDYERDVLSRTKLMQGFEQFIHKAREKGLKLAIDTNRTELGIRRVLDFFHLPPYFDPIINSSNCAPKPAPLGAEKICAAWKTPPGKVLFVGDSENDKETAEGAGVLFAAFGGKGLSGDIEVATYADLEKILWG
ncbi:MAG: HAD family hydrolase [Desulfovibrio sp.]|nr:HAD family hydrolase [Desulfovibrio sp.]